MNQTKNRSVKNVAVKIDIRIIARKRYATA